MKACIVGRAKVEFVDDNGELIEGLNLYYFAPKDEVDGFFAGKLWVKQQSKLYHKVMSLDTDKPFMADLDYDVQPGKKMTAVLQDIRPMDGDEISKLIDHPSWSEFAAILTV